MLKIKKQSLIYIAQFPLMAAVCVLLIISSDIQAVGQMPIPKLDKPSLAVTTSYNAKTDRYTYHYRIDNPATSTGDIWRFKIDIHQRTNIIWNYRNLKIPFGSKNLDFLALYKKLQPFYLPKGYTITPIGQTVPDGWAGGFGRDGMAGFASKTGNPMISPGQTLGGFSMTSPGLPAIRQAEIIPNWVLVVEDHDKVTTETEIAANKVNKQIRQTTYTLGPTGNMIRGSFTHWSFLQRHINKAIEIQWIKDQRLIKTITLTLKKAADAVKLKKGKLAKSLLREILISLANSSNQQRNQAFHDLLYYNVKELIKFTKDIPANIKPKTALPPKSGRQLSVNPPDLVIAFFIPPMLITKGGNPLYINVITANIGNNSSPASKTRFYISPNQTIDPKKDYVLGEYSVKDLAAEEREKKQFTFKVPKGFPQGKYYLAACADAENTIIELKESNNCSFSEINYIRR